MQQPGKFEAIGRFIGVFQQVQPLVDDLMLVLHVDLSPANVLHEKLTGLEDALAMDEAPRAAHAADPPPPAHAAIAAFLRHLRSMESMNLPLEAFAALDDEEAARYAECAALGEQLAGAVRAGLGPVRARARAVPGWGSLPSRG